MNLLGTVTTIEDQIVDTLETTEAFVVDAFKTVAATLEPVVLEIPVPYVDQLPQPGAVIDNVADFAIRLVKNQQAFAHKLLDAANAARSTDPGRKTDSGKPTIVREPATKTA